MDRRHRNCIGCAICAQPEILCTNISHDTAYTKIERHRMEELVQENESMRKQIELLRFVLRKHEPTYHNVHEIYFESCEGSVDECQSSHKPIKVEVNQQTQTPFVRVHEIHVEQKKPLDDISEKSPRSQKHRVRSRRSPRKLNIKSADRQWNMEYSSAAQSTREPLRQKVKFDTHNDRYLALQDNLGKSKPIHRKINVTVLPATDDTQPSSASRVIDKRKFVRVQEIDIRSRSLDGKHKDLSSSRNSDVVESQIQKHRVRGRRSTRELNIESTDREWNMEYSRAPKSAKEDLRQKINLDAALKMYVSLVNTHVQSLHDNLQKSEPSHRKINDKVLADTDQAQLSSANSVRDEKKYFRVHGNGLGAQTLDREHTDFSSFHSGGESMKSDVVESPIKNRKKTESEDGSQDMQRTGVDSSDSGIFDNLWDCSSLSSWRTLRFKHRYTAALADKYFPYQESHDSNKSLISKTVITGRETTPQNRYLNFQDWLHGVTSNQSDVRTEQHMDHPPEYFHPDNETVIVFE